MSRPAPLIFRLSAIVLWMLSLECLTKAIEKGAALEMALRLNPIPDVVTRTSEAADRWAELGWFMQIVTAAVLALGIESRRVVRRIFIALGLLILADGLPLLLLVAVIVRA